MSLRYALTLSLLAAPVSGWAAERIESKSAPRPIPLTRPEMKQFLEDMKERTPRIPLPELTDADREALGERADSYESRLRYHYLPGGRTAASGGAGGPGGAGARGGAGGGFGGFGGFGFSRDPDPAMSLDYAFKTELFWIVSRTNNCQYCLGHQESKLLNAGLTEDQIAGLDGDWSEFKPSEQVAFAFARKLTYEPHHLTDADFEGLRKHYTDLQILEMVLSISGNNAINRWKEGAGIPQSRNGGGFGRRSADGKAVAPTPAEQAAHQSYLTPTSEKFLAAITRVAPVSAGAAQQKSAPTLFSREPLEKRVEAERALHRAASRTPRLPLVDEAKCRERLGEDWKRDGLPQWVRLLANFPRDGKLRILSQVQAEEAGDLSPLVKAQVSWIVARQDRAWYAAGLAQARLRALGWSDDQIFALDRDWKSFTPAERAAFNVAQKLAATPVVLTDDDVAAAVKQIGPRDVTQLISYTTTCASFNRITEAAGLQIDR